MPGKESDKVQREIEEILDKLDNFVPEERFVEKIRARRKRERATNGPGAIDRLWSRLSRITLGHLMLAGLACFIIALIFGGALGALATWLWVAGLLLTVGAFAMSVITGGGGRQTIGTGRVQKQWRGRTIEYGEPSAMDRLRGWFRRRSSR
jgi:hypothetical protein